MMVYSSLSMIKTVAVYKIKILIDYIQSLEVVLPIGHVTLTSPSRDRRGLGHPSFIIIYSEHTVNTCIKVI